MFEAHLICEISNQVISFHKIWTSRSILEIRTQQTRTFYSTPILLRVATQKECFINFHKWGGLNLPFRQYNLS